MTSSDPSRTTPAVPASAPGALAATAPTIVAAGASTSATVAAPGSATDAVTVVTRGIATLPPGVPTDIGGVRLVRVLGTGAMGEVYLGRHATMDRDVAVKLMKAQAGADGDRFLQEVRAAAKIAHPHVIQVLHAGTEGGRLFLVMELVGGGDVAQLIRRDGRVPWRRAVELMIQAAEGLGAAHRAGIVHRDVKPANLLLTSLAADGQLKVADLGLAKHHQHDQQASAIDLTQAGTVMGTPAYMAPEQALDARHARPPADVYALGVSLFHLLTGRLPFQADTSNAMLLAHANQPVPDLRALAADVPESVVAVVRRMLAKSPDDRPRDGAAAAAELRAAAASAGSPGAAAPGDPAAAAPAPPRVPRSLAIAALAGVVILGCVSGFVASRSSHPGDPSRAAASANPPESPAQAAAAKPAVDPWQTPTRAGFVIANDDALAAVASAIESGLLEARVLLVERTELDRVLLKEIALAKGADVNIATAVKAGNLVGGHVALLVRPANERVNLRAVLIQTGEMVGSEVVDADQAPVRGLALMRRALAQLPVQARLERDAGGAWRVSAGRQHGVAVGDRFSIHAADPAGTVGAGPATAVATVDAVDATAATVTLDGGAPERLPALAQRVTP